MLGIRKVDTTYLTHRNFWFDCWVNLVGIVLDLGITTLGILTLGRLTADWDIRWFNLTFTPPKGLSFKRHS